MKPNPPIPFGLKRTMVPLAGIVLAMAAFMGLAMLAKRSAKLDNDSELHNTVKVMGHHRSLHHLLMEWAMRHEGKFPDTPGPAESNFTDVSPAGQIDKASVLVSPRGYSTAYIAGLDAAADGNTPILITALTPTLAFLTGQSTSAPDPEQVGPVYITRINGSASRWTESNVQPIVGGQGAPSAGQVRMFLSDQN